MNISVLIKEPGKGARREVISNTLESLQLIVGGYIQAVTLCEDIVFICDEEGRLKKLPFNAEILDIDFVGTLIIAGSSGDEFTSLKPATERAMKKLLPQLFSPGSNCYTNTEISRALEMSDLMKLGELLTELTGNTVSFIVCSGRDDTKEHTHIITENGSVDDIEREKMNKYISNHGGSIYIRNPEPKLNPKANLDAIKAVIRFESILYGEENI